MTRKHRLKMPAIFHSCTEQAEYDLDVAKLSFVGMLLAVLAYGVHTTLFLVCLRPLYRRDLRLLAYMTTVFCLATTGIAVQIWWYQSIVITKHFRHNGSVDVVFLTHHAHHAANLARTTIYVVMNWLSEGILLYRFYVIFNVLGGHTIIFAVISLLVLAILIVTGGICIPAIVGLGFAWLPDTCDVPGIVYLSLTMSSHVILTCLIVGRILWFRHRVRTVFGSRLGKTYTSLVAILIESASLYTIWAMTSVILYGLNSRLQFVFLPAIGQVQAIPPLLIITWVVNGRALGRDTYSSMFPSTKPSEHSIRFSSHVVCSDPPSYPSSAYISPSSECKFDHFPTPSNSSIKSFSDKDWV